MDKTNLNSGANITNVNTTIQDSNDYANRFKRALTEIANFISFDRIVDDAETAYGNCTTGTTRRIPIALLVENKQEIIQILKIAQQHQVPVYPISTGKNWGYGTSNPVENFCILLDLSRLNKILNFDPDLATVRVEPGVTQGQLHEYMQQNNFKFLVPSTGAGPHTSLMGNILERGYGITPHMDHFAALIALEAVLPTGEIYQSALEDAKCPELNRNFKWGLGPFLDGLFAQSNFGIVTECTIALMKKPESVNAFVFTLKNDADLTLATEALRKLNQDLPGILGGMNLMNARRMLAMNVPYPKYEVAPQQAMSVELVQKLRQKNSIEIWTGIGGIYGTEDVAKAAKKHIKKTLKPFVKELKFVNEATLNSLKLGAKYLPGFLGGAKLKTFASRVGKLLDVVSGIPTEAALPLAYWKSNKQYKPGQNVNIAQDGCGLIWYSPLVLNRPDQVRKYIQFVETTCAKYGIEPLITLTTVSERCFDSTVPLLFNRQDSEETQRAQACYKTLLRQGQKLGFFPYRLGIDQMNEVTNDTSSTSWQLVEKIKQALDPNGILSPGRYCPTRVRK